MAAKKKAVKKKVTKKRGAKKRVAKKKVTAKRSTRPSQATGKAPTKRLIKRRAQNTRKGYFPNPIATLYVIKIMKGEKAYYFNGKNGDTVKANAAYYRNVATAKKIAQSVADAMGKTVSVAVESTELAGKKKAA